jgi:hypothetical protein
LSTRKDINKDGKRKATRKERKTREMKKKKKEERERI